jgi:hypothetical protein
MNNFIWNLFSPRSTRQEDAVQHADDEDDSSLNDLGDDPLSNFFNTTDLDEYEADAGNAIPNLSFTQWREGRRRFLEKYFQHRLCEVQEEVTSSAIVDNGNDDDGDSFSSEVLDDDFNTHVEMKDSPSKAVAEAQTETDNTSQKSQDESEVLETQPQTQLPLKTPMRSANKESSQRSGKSTLSSINTPEGASGSGRKRRSPGGLFSGIKRKLGFLQQEEEGPDDHVESTESVCPVKPDSFHRPKKKRRRTKDSKMQRGLMWNADFSSIPQVSEASCYTSKLQEVDLHTQNLDLGLCKILRVWEIRDTQRMNKHTANRRDDSQETLSSSQQTDTEHSIYCMSSQFAYYEDDGPMNTIYKRVISIEIVQMDDATQLTTLSSPRVSNFAKAAFGSGQKQLQKASERKRRHAVRRIYIFFYDGYADIVSSVLGDMYSKSKQKKPPTHCLISLENIPAHCIMPHFIAEENPRLQHYINNPFGDEDFGALSPYCICVGDASALKFDSEKESFDSDELQIRFVDARVAGDNGCTVDSPEGEDFVVKRNPVSEGVEVHRKREPSTLLKRFWNNNSGQGRMSVRDKDAMTETADDPKLSATSEAPKSIDLLNAGEETHSGEATANIRRPTSVSELSDMLPLLRKNGMQRLKASVTVYGVVLGFSPPSLTKYNDWKMSLVLIDESLPISTETENEQQSGELPPNTDERSNKTKANMPAITVVLFVKEKIHLPVIRSAGDVVCCRNAILQQYNDEPQLICGRRSSVVVARPSQTRSPGVELHDSTSPDWSLSCSCHEDSSQAPHPQLHWELANDLWQWGQKRLSSHPTISPNCKLSISGLDQPAEDVEVPNTNVDLTAVITAIIPFPGSPRHDTPRGWVRLWDGTGPPRSDP